MQKTELFSSRWGLLLAAIGMAVGTGNIWRFPRIVATNGGGAFLIPWLIFLFLWSIPLLMVETTMGRRAKRGPVGAFAELVGSDRAWMGAFVGFCSMAIMFYYSVVAGWCFKYLLGALTGSVTELGGEGFWNEFQSVWWEPVLFHLVAIGVAAAIVYRGVVSGIEKVTTVLIPLLFLLLVGGSIRALTLPGAADGLNFLFNPDLSLLLDYRIWLEALTQSAWSTGAGWGLLLTYAIYTSRDDDIVMNAATIGFGNNSASLLAGILVVCSVFGLVPAGGDVEEILTAAGPGNTALSFYWIPELFERMPGGRLALILFFLALVVAAISSLIAMIELATRMFIDAGLDRKRALLMVGTGGFLLGLPSALSLSVFVNQDAVWGIGLMISGLLFALGVRRFGARRFREELIEPADNDLPIGSWFDFLIKYVIPVEVALMLGWWLYQAATSAEAWWDPFATFSLGTCLVQWGIAMALFYWANDWMARRTLADD